ncbi:MAG: HEAT repeat domain-containing protein [Verrucomicrobia bacterium]|nr:HEAT repeat domain-containing protein [Verrucomicrobiota bacterium]
MRRAILLVTAALSASLIAMPSLCATPDTAVKENPWLLLDAPDRAVLGRIGIGDNTTLQIGTGLMRNAVTRHEDPTVRAACAKVLGRLEVKAASDVLMWALNDREAAVRREAAIALGVLKERRAVEPLGVLWRKEPDAENRVAVIQALGVIADRRAGAILAEALIMDPDERIRSKAAEVISAMEDGRAWKQLIQALSDKSPGVRIQAAHALGALEDKRAVDELIACLQDEHPEVRGAAAGALGRIDSSKSVGPLIELLQDSHDGVRGTTATALGQLKAKKAVKPLEKIAEGDPNEWVREQAANALTAIREDD